MGSGSQVLGAGLCEAYRKPEKMVSNSLSAYTAFTAQTVDAGLWEDSV